MVSNSLKTSTNSVHGGLFWCFPNSPDSDVDCRIFNPFTAMVPLENDQEKCKIWNPFCFLFRTGFWKDFHPNTLHWKEMCYRNGSYPVCDSEGVMVYVCLWSFHILVYVHSRPRFIVSSKGLFQSRHRIWLGRNLRVAQYISLGNILEYVSMYTSHCLYARWINTIGGTSQSNLIMFLYICLCLIRCCPSVLVLTSSCLQSWVLGAKRPLQL